MNDGLGGPKAGSSNDYDPMRATAWPEETLAAAKKKADDDEAARRAVDAAKEAVKSAASIQELKDSRAEKAIALKESMKKLKAGPQRDDKADVRRTPTCSRARTSLSSRVTQGNSRHYLNHPRSQQLRHGRSPSRGTTRPEEHAARSRHKSAVIVFTLPISASALRRRSQYFPLCDTADDEVDLLHK